MIGIMMGIEIRTEKKRRDIKRTENIHIQDLDPGKNIHIIDDIFH